ncbi:MAG: hypothetical protein Q8Q42_02690 [Nanoarchaeota archaeon]|nr:hypothetical protein [Nanoarchaeota archaeon]
MNKKSMLIALLLITATSSFMMGYGGYHGSYNNYNMMQGGMPYNGFAYNSMMPVRYDMNYGGYGYMMGGWNMMGSRMGRMMYY